jgi:hypothetical protein
MMSGVPTLIPLVLLSVLLAASERAPSDRDKDERAALLQDMYSRTQTFCGTFHEEGLTRLDWSEKNLPDAGRNFLTKVGRLESELPNQEGSNCDSP